MIDVVLCYRSGAKEAMKLAYPLPNPFTIFLRDKRYTFEYYAQVIIDGGMRRVIYLEAQAEP